MDVTIEAFNISSKRYLEIRSFTQDLCKPLKTEDYVAQPIIDVSPPKWHLAHTTWFFETFILKEFVKGYKIFHQDYNFLFNSYYNTAGDRVIRPSRGNMTRPSVEEVLEFRAYVDEHMVKLLDEGIKDESLAHFIEVGLNHEQQHQELLICDIKYILNQAPLYPAYKDNFQKSNLKSRPLQYYRFDEGVYEIGFEGNEFSFDNERGKHKTFLHAFSIADRLVNNAEYMEFILDGGYENSVHWLSDGWDWVQNNNINSPLYWFKDDGDWKQFTLYGKQDIDWYAPVTHVSFYEADAFARWKGQRLATEAEWEVACLDYGDIDKGNFVDSGKMKPLADGNNQFYGDCWEWCNSAYLPYPGYEQAEGALGEYNGKFMINQMVLRGGSCATSKSHIRPTYRNFFHPNLQWQYTGVRLAKDI